MADIFDNRANQLSSPKKSKNSFKKQAEYYNKTKTFFSESPEGQDLGTTFKQGIQGSSLGQALGFSPTDMTTNVPMSQSLTKAAGTIAGDIPAMTGGATIGGLVGGPVGAGAGAFAFPELIKQIQEYRRKPKKERLLDKISDVAQIPWQTVKQGVVGAATSFAGALAPLIKFSNPAVSRVAKSALGEALVKGGAEFAGMTGSQSVLEGRVPSVRELGENAILLGGMKGVGLAAKGIRAVTPESIKAPIGKAVESVKAKASGLIPEAAKQKVQQYKDSQKYYNLLRKHIGEKNKSIVESQFKWRNELEKAQIKEKLTPKQLEEALYYRQKTGNPSIKGDTYEQLSTRIPKELQKTVDTVIDDHFKTTREFMNKHKYIKDVNPRDALVDKYMPGMYEPSKDFGKVYDKVAKQLKFKNPMAEMKNFLDYQEAFEKAGLKPRFKNIFQMMEGYDRTFARTVSGANMLQDLEGLQSKSDSPIVVTNRTPKLYKIAQQAGFVPFDDFTLRGYTKKGTTSGKPTLMPALVAPEAAGAFKGIFSQEAFKPKSPFLKAYDTLGDMARFGRVRLSFFHFVPLTESSAGALGVRKAFNFRNIAEQGNDLRGNAEFMSDAAEHGLKVEPVERYQRAKKLGAKTQELADRLSEKALKKIPEKVVDVSGKALKAISSPLRTLARAQKYLFEQYHPNLKAVTYQNFIDKAFSELVAEGKAPSAAERTKIKYDMADLTNALYGGQNWEIQRVFNSPQYRKWLSRAIGYPDWCSDYDTRAMTKTGWKYHHELSIGDEIMAFDPKTKNLVWNKLNDMYVNTDYDGDMVQIKNYNRAIMVTPDHTCYVEHDKSRKNLILKAAELNTHHKIPRCADFATSEKEIYNDYLIKIVGWLVTDGHIFKRKRKKVDGTFSSNYEARITQTKPHTVEILKDLGLSFYVDMKNYDHGKFKANYPKYVFRIPTDEVKNIIDAGINAEDKTLTWKFLSKLSKRQLELLYETMMFGDGTGQNRFCGKERAVFYMTLVQAMLGKPTTFYQQEKNCWRTRIVKSKTISCHDKKIISYKGTIWCPSVDTGFWVAERKGLMFITGNTTSAVRQAANVFSGGLKGQNARNYWIKFGVNSVAAHSLLQFMFGGMEQSDKKDYSVKGIRWNPEKARQSVLSPDPIEWFKFPLPDVPVKIGGKMFNPGRDAGTKWKPEGTKLYSHFGKQALEIKDEMYHPFSTLFSKSNPLIQMAWKQVLGSSPSKRDPFAVRSRYVPASRKWEAWDATKKGTPERFVSRAAQLVEDVAPFSMHALKQHGVAPYLATGLASVPISKGTTKYKAEPELEKAFKKNDIKTVNRIRTALKDNGWSDKQIRLIINKARKASKD